MTNNSNRWILGVNAVGFNTSTVLLRNGEVVAAVEEERLTREKRCRRFPIEGIKWALKSNGISLSDISSIAVSWNPLVNLELHNGAQSDKLRYLGEALYSVPSHIMRLNPDCYADNWMSQKLRLENGVEIDVYYVNHHLSHASCYYSSGFSESAILTTDAFGEKEAITFYKASGTELKKLYSQEFPNSLGAYYSTLTEYLGFQAQSDEWKLMGASSYGDSQKYFKQLEKLFIERKSEELGFMLDLRYFNFYQFHRPKRYTKELVDLLKLPPRDSTKQELNQDHYDLAASAQAIFEKYYFMLMEQLHHVSGSSNLVIAGGSALNSVANGKITENTSFKNLFIPSVPDDSGAALGAAQFIEHSLHKAPLSYEMKHNYLGPSYSEEEIKESIEKYKIHYTVLKSRADEVAKLIADGNIIGWFQGAIEFGDRALGHRSILADPRKEQMKELVNATVKYREAFRPFAPSVLEEEQNNYFEKSSPTPFMEKVFKVKQEKRNLIPAVTHVDGSGRLQTVRFETNPEYWQLIDAFRKLTGIPIVLNTSFNLKGEPIVCSPTDAIRTFFSSGLDCLVLGNYLIRK